MSSSAPKRRPTGRGAAAPAEGADGPRRRMPAPALALAVVLIVAGLGAIGVSAAAEETGFAADYESVASVYNTEAGTRFTDLDPADAVDRDLLERQTAEQSRQREAALRQLADRTAESAAEQRLNQWIVPVVGFRLTSLFGEISPLRSGPHGGIDLAAPSGTTIVAVAGGTVVTTGFGGACGLGTRIRLDDGWQMLYCHQSATVVRTGERVQPGQRIGFVGSTGNSTGPHLHLEIWRPDGTRVDPLPKLAEHGVHLR